MLEGATATDLVLTITERLRKHGVVGKFVEFFGPGLEHLTIADRATLGNMCPEYGATIAIFPIDAMTLDYLRLTGRDASRVAAGRGVREGAGPVPRRRAIRIRCTPRRSSSISRRSSRASPGPKRPQDRVSLKQAKSGFQAALGSMQARDEEGGASDGGQRRRDRRATAAVAVLPAVAQQLEHGSVVIAAITSCTNTSNPSVMIGAGLLAKKAVERGLTQQAVGEDQPGARLEGRHRVSATRPASTPYLDQLGFNLVGYGCTTCIGNSGPLPDDVSAEVEARNLVVASVLSGNRNFEGRIQQQVRANYLASPPLVVAYALAGTMTIDLTTEPLGTSTDGEPVYLRDLWPTEREIQETMLTSVTSEMFREQYADVFSGDERWQTLHGADRRPLRLGAGLDLHPQPAVLRRTSRCSRRRSPTSRGARVLALLGDSITTDHISPAGSIKKDSPAGKYLIAHGVAAARLQLVRRAPRQPRSDDARHVRQHPAAQSARARHRRRLDDVPAGRRGDDDLRRGDEVQGRGRAAASSSPARNTARDRRATGRRRARCCSA